MSYVRKNNSKTIIGIANPPLHDVFRVKAAEEYISISKTPILRWVLQNFLFTFVVPIVIVVRKYYNQKIWMCMWPVFITLLTLLLSPLVNTRYTMSLVFVTPLVMSYSAICEKTPGDICNREY